MTEHKLQCRIFSTDALTARLVSTRTGVCIAGYDVDGETGRVVASPDAVRTFARGLLALADEVDGGADPELSVQADDDAAQNAVKVGDRVVVVAEYSDGTGYYVGVYGQVAEIDAGDPEFPYRVVVDGTPYSVWVHSVRLENEEPTQTDSTPASVAPERRAFLEEARSLVGSIDVGQLLEVARFLAGE
ncbi:hypothetical protein [Streptomyces lydicus]|uniref:hypothetical protein n=1 Tax=Streptomyces lydicus TaxID=47763 RepID=UPI0037AF3A26